jgi:hypothetical protein
MVACVPRAHPGWRSDCAAASLRAAENRVRPRVNETAGEVLDRVAIRMGPARRRERVGRPGVRRRKKKKNPERPSHAVRFAQPKSEIIVSWAGAAVCCRAPKPFLVNIQALFLRVKPPPHPPHHPPSPSLHFPGPAPRLLGVKNRHPEPRRLTFPFFPLSF